jgi:hypothetical protein
VLVAAGRRGAIVSGIECDPDLAEQARNALAANELDGQIIVGDLFDPLLDIDADVILAYLAPATLQRLLPRLRALPARLVTLDFAMPDLEPDDIDGHIRRYDMPGRTRPPRQPGWTSAGTLVVTLPDVATLSCLDLHHPGGPVSVAIGPDLRASGALLTGADHAEPGAPVAVDLRWDGLVAGTLVTGDLWVDGVAPHRIVTLFSDEGEGQWELSTDGVANLERWLHGRGPGVVSAAELLRAAEG